MIETPARYGWTWDAITDTFDNGASPELVAALRDDTQDRRADHRDRGNVTSRDESSPDMGSTGPR